MNKYEASFGDLLSALSKDLTAEDILLIGLKAEIASAITSKRIGMEMNQKEFAEYMGVTQGLVSRWENGDTNFTLESLVAIAQKLEIKLQSPFTVNKLRSYTSEGNIINIDDWRAVKSVNPSWKSSSNESRDLEEM